MGFTPTDPHAPSWPKSWTSSDPRWWELQVLSRGTHVIRGIRLGYQVNEVSYMVTIPDSFRLRAPISEYPSCEPISESNP